MPPSEHTPSGHTPSDYIADTIARIRAKHDWVQLALSEAGDKPGEWAPFEAFATPELRDRAVEAEQTRYKEYGKLTPTVAGTYLFRDLVLYPLLLAGCCFIEARRVPLLGGVFEVRLDGEAGAVRLRRARLAVLPDDPLATRANTEDANIEGYDGIEVEPDIDALAERLFREVTDLCTPVIDCFRERRYVAVSNAWGGILDALAQSGVETAADLGLGKDEAWTRWEAAIAGRAFPVRRRPRRLTYEWAPGQHDEVTVRAGCCLYYTTEEAQKTPEHQYCSTCYLETDENRIRHMVEWKQSVAAGAADAEE